MYADLGRPYVLKNLFASAEFSISLQRWCYPVVGCTGYRGYFDDGLLQEFKLMLEQQGKDVYVANISAYSTLGWFDDPVLSTFINWPEHRLAGLIFHELAHQRLYIDDDSQFNESFAMAIQQTAVEKWLQEHARFKQLKRYKQKLRNRQVIIQLIGQSRQQLKQLYASELTEDEKRVEKHQILTGLRQSYQLISSKFDVPDGFKYWFQGELNNAKLASLSTYHSAVDAFRNLLKSHHGEYAEFYRHVNSIGELEKLERHSCLDNWGQTGNISGEC